MAPFCLRPNIFSNKNEVELIELKIHFVFNQWDTYSFSREVIFFCCLITKIQTVSKI